MSMFEKASRMKLRVASPRGGLTVSDLWDLPLGSLNTIAKELNRKLKAEEEEDFLAEKPVADKKLKLSFDITLHILNTKKKELEAREDAACIAAKKAKLLELLERKQDEGLANLSEDELKAQIEGINKAHSKQVALCIEEE